MPARTNLSTRTTGRRPKAFSEGTRGSWGRAPERATSAMGIWRVQPLLRGCSGAGRRDREALARGLDRARAGRGTAIAPALSGLSQLEASRMGERYRRRQLASV